ncbi:MAG: TonB family protein [Erythrobacter sp.]|nr:TonB family protein [Erythrobacter sp.]
MTRHKSAVATKRSLAMSYANATVSPAARLRAASGVIAIHAVMAVGVVAGLAITGVIAPPDTDTDVFNIPLDPPEVEPEVVPDDQVLTYVPPAAPVPPVNLVQNDPIEVVPVGPVISEVVIRDPRPELVAPPAPPPAPPAPLYDPVGPVPRNAQSWITTNDYSRADLTRNREGTAGYRLVVGSDGRVDACEITRSSGHASLDTATCRLLERRARFDAARDGRGERVVGSYSGSVTWQIPD